MKKEEFECENCESMFYIEHDERVEFCPFCGESMTSQNSKENDWYIDDE